MIIIHLFKALFSFLTLFLVLSLVQVKSQVWPGSEVEAQTSGQADNALGDGLKVGVLSLLQIWKMHLSSWKQSHHVADCINLCVWED